ncbi:MAG: DUF1501 domain-containing protein, partial [Verrucomicrobiota bacterium]|nr:DUF1501 domain-containing protein [Verrucomicrobiota bacterium]
MEPGLSRRSFFETTASGFAGLALGQALAAEAADDPIRHHRPKAKRVIQLFMNGGVSQMDTFDHKPVLDALN